MKTKIILLWMGLLLFTAHIKGGNRSHESGSRDCKLGQPDCPDFLDCEKHDFKFSGDSKDLQSGKGVLR